MVFHQLTICAIPYDGLSTLTEAASYFMLKAKHVARFIKNNIIC